VDYFTTSEQGIQRKSDNLWLATEGGKENRGCFGWQKGVCHSFETANIVAFFLHTWSYQ